MKRLAALALLTFAWNARADLTKMACIDANTQGQAHRLDGRLGAARTQFLVCADPSCPTIVREDCERRRDEIESVQPSIVLDVADGVELDGARLDGRPIDVPAAGAAIKVDPGAHSLVLSAKERAPVTLDVTVKLGEKEKHARVVFAPPVAPPPETKPETKPPPPPPSRGGRRTIAVVLGGSGLAAAIVGTVFGSLTFGAVSAENAACPGTTCPDLAHFKDATGAHDDAVTFGAVADVAFVAAAVLVAAGVVVWATAPKTVKLAVGPTGAVLAGSF